MNARARNIWTPPCRAFALRDVFAQHALAHVLPPRSVAALSVTPLPACARVVLSLHRRRHHFLTPSRVASPHGGRFTASAWRQNKRAVRDAASATFSRCDCCCRAPDVCRYNACLSGIVCLVACGGVAQSCTLFPSLLPVAFALLLLRLACRIPCRTLAWRRLAAVSTVDLSHLLRAFYADSCIAHCWRVLAFDSPYVCAFAAYHLILSSYISREPRAA